MLSTEVTYSFTNAEIAEKFVEYIRQTDDNAYSLKDEIVTAYIFSDKQKLVFLTAAAAFNAALNL